MGGWDTRRSGGSRGDGQKELGLQGSLLKESVQGRAAQARNGPPGSWRAACRVSCRERGTPPMLSSIQELDTCEFSS